MLLPYVFQAKNCSYETESRMLKEIKCPIGTEGVVSFVSKRRVVLRDLCAGVWNVQIYFRIQLDSVVAHRPLPEK